MAIPWCSTTTYVTLRLLRLHSEKSKATLNLIQYEKNDEGNSSLNANDSGGIYRRM